MQDIIRLKKLLKEAVGADPNLPITAVVKSVEANTCTVTLKSGLTLSDVKLQATANDNDDYTRLTPKVGSTVLMISYDGTLRNLAVIKVDNLDKIEYKNKGLEVVIDGTDGKVSVKNNGYSMLTAMNDLAKIIKKLKVHTPVGPSGLPLPDTLAAVALFETNIKTLLK